MKKWISILLLPCWLCAVSYAADETATPTPTTVEKPNKEDYINQTASSCVDNECGSSSDRDCPENCRAKAEEKYRSQYE